METLKLLALIAASINVVAIGGVVAEDYGDTLVGGQVPTKLILLVPESFNFADFTPSSTPHSHTGSTSITANVNWVLKVEDNSAFYVPAYGPGNGYMTRQPYSGDPATATQLDESMVITIDGNSVALKDTPAHSPGPIASGGPGVNILKDTTFSQEVKWGDEIGDYVIIVTFIIEEDY
jgi:hypothetical protein